MRRSQKDKDSKAFAEVSTIRLMSSVKWVYLMCLTWVYLMCLTWVYLMCLTWLVVAECAEGPPGAAISAGGSGEAHGGLGGFAVDPRARTRAGAGAGAETDDPS